MKRQLPMILSIVSMFIYSSTGFSVPLIIDHNDIDITKLTEQEISYAKSILHIGYGHTSHGSQITDGMNGLVTFANNGGLGLSLPNNIFAWNNGGTGGALDLEEGAGYGSGWLELDGGYWPSWYNETIEYLDDPTHTNVNVIMWSWCGQMDDKYAGGTLSNEYLIPMSNLETSYPDVVFVYMTGHVEIGNDANNKAACEAIRNYCIENNKVFFDFNDIEHYNPDGTYFEFVGDDCSYYDYAGGAAQGNWATEWQDSHTEGTDWYSCGSAHSQPLNANMKAYAIWTLWCKLAADMDRDGLPDQWEDQYGGSTHFDSSTGDTDGDGQTNWEEYIADTNPTNSHSNLRITTVFENGEYRLNTSCTNSRTYNLENTSCLITGNWTGVTGCTNLTGNANGHLEIDLPTNNASDYYRVSVAVPSQ